MFDPRQALGFVRIGRIMDALPRFKAIAIYRMRLILNECQTKSWGSSFIFKLGIQLERGDVVEVEGDARVGCVIINEFSRETPGRCPPNLFELHTHTRTRGNTPRRAFA